jgi:hypothetical protein
MSKYSGMYFVWEKLKKFENSFKRYTLGYKKGTIPGQLQLRLNQESSQLCIGFSIFYMYRGRDEQALPEIFYLGKVSFF